VLPVTKAHHALTPGVKPFWNLNIGDGVLSASLGLAHGSPRYSVAKVSPTILLANLSTALLVENCDHDADQALEAMDQFCKFTGVLNSTQPASLSKDKNYMITGVIAVHNDHDLQFFALSCGDNITPVVIHKTACLGCSLCTCRKTGYPVLVL
jgi:hypothetical protein